MGTHQTRDLYVAIFRYISIYGTISLEYGIYNLYMVTDSSRPVTIYRMCYHIWIHIDIPCYHTVYGYIYPYIDIVPYIDIYRPVP